MKQDESKHRDWLFHRVAPLGYVDLPDKDGKIAERKVENLDDRKRESEVVLDDSERAGIRHFIGHDSADS